MENNEAFTLAELLVTIVIIGILSSIGIIGITNLRKNQEIKFNNTQLQVFRQAAQIYFTDNKERLPLDFGEERVYLDELIKNNYIDKLLDYNKKEYNEEKSYVTAMRVFDKYVYTATLVTEGKNSEIIDDTDNNDGKIKIEMLNKINCTNSSNNYSESCTGSTEEIKEYYANKNVKLNIELEDPKNKIFAYNYTVYKNGLNIYTSEYIRANDDTNYNDIITLNTKRYDDGIYRIEIKGVNKKYQLMTKKTPDIYIDVTKPTCKVNLNGTKGNNGWFKNKAVSVELSRSDKGGSGLYTYGLLNSKQVSYNKQSNITQNNTSGIVYYGYVKDRAGNTNNCESENFKVDTTAPKCETEGESTSWTSGNRTLTFKCSDNESGCVKSQEQMQFSSTLMKQELNVNVYDKAGNITLCKSKNNNTSYDIHVDKTIPTTPQITGGSNSWKNYGQIIWVSNSNSAYSGIKKYQYCKTTEATANGCTWHDLYNNTGQVTESGLDVGYYHSIYKDLMDHYKGNVKGLNQHYINYGKKENRKKQDSSWLRTAQNFSDEGVYNIFFRIVNNANTVSKASNMQTLKMDYTAPAKPTISNSSNGNTVCATNVVINANSSDSLSGVNQITYSYDNSNWQKDWNTNNITSVSGTWSAKRNNTVYIRSCDNAGNCSSSVSTKIHIQVKSASSACGQTCGNRIYGAIPNTQGNCNWTGKVKYDGSYWTATGKYTTGCKGNVQACCKAYRCSAMVNKTCCHD